MLYRVVYVLEEAKRIPLVLDKFKGLSQLELENQPFQVNLRDFWLVSSQSGVA